MRVVLADEQASVRSALRLLLTKELHMQVVGETTDVQGVRALLKMACPDLLLVAWKLFDGQPAATVLALRSLCPHLLVVALSGHEEERRSALAAGMDGFVNQADAATRVITVLQELRANEAPREELSHER
jgi:DNA-binding NarL/FixJ family response regulator